MQSNTPTLREALKSVETAFRASKPYIPINDAIVLYRAIMSLQKQGVINNTR